jgi:hypothetical protein
MHAEAQQASQAGVGMYVVNPWLWSSTAKLHTIANSQQQRQQQVQPTS